MPVTIATGSAGTATQLEPQRAVWRNPRGQKAYYAIVQEGGTNGLRLYKSTDGTSWSLVQQLCGTGSGYSATYSASAYYYEDAANSQLIVYVAYSEGGSWNSGRKLYYRRLLIPDNTTTPTVGGEQDTGKTGSVHAAIAQDRNGYVHIIAFGNSSNRDQVVIFGTTTAYPSVAPSWSAVTAVWSHGGSTAYDDTSTLVVFGGSSNILGAIGFGRSGSNNRLHGRNIVSFNGTSYTLGTDTTIEDCDGVYHPLNAVVDTDNVAHLVWHNAASGKVGVRYAKASAASTVESWGTIASADANAPDTCALAINLDASPNMLYLFYQYGAADDLYYRARAVNGDSWSNATTVDDGGGEDLDWIQATPKFVSPTISVIYSTQTTYKARFYLLSVGGQLYYQSMSAVETAGLSLAAKSLYKRTLAVVGSAAATLGRALSLNRALSVMEATVGSLMHKGTWHRTLALTEVTLAALKRKMFRGMSVIESSLVALQKKTKLSLIITEVAALSLAGKALFKRTLSVVESATATLARNLTLKRALSVVEVAVASLAHKSVMLRNLAAAATAAVSLAYARWQQVLMNVVEASAASLTRVILFKRTLSLVESASASILSQLALKRALSIIEVTAAALSRQALRYRVLTVTIVSVASIKRSLSLLLTVIENSVTSLARQALRYRSLIVTEIGLLALAPKSLFKRTLSVVESASGSLTRKVAMYRTLTVTEITAVSLSRMIRFLRTLTLAVTATANMTYLRFLQRALIVTAKIVVTLAHGVGEALRAILRLLAQRLGFRIISEEMGLTLSASEYGLTLTLEKE